MCKFLFYFIMCVCVSPVYTCVYRHRHDILRLTKPYKSSTKPEKRNLRKNHDYSIKEKRWKKRKQKYTTELEHSSL